MEKRHDRLSLEEGEQEEEKTEKEEVAKNRIIGKGKMRRNGRRWIKKRKKRKTRSRKRNSTAVLRLDLPPSKVLFYVLGGGGAKKNPR